jgi:hypothetical protein
MSTNYLVYEDYETALNRAEVEGRAMGYPYYSTDPNVYKGDTKYKTTPKLLKNGKYALVVDGYELTEDEESAITTSVTFPEPEEV